MGKTLSFKLKLAVFRRDRGICADCGCDCEMIMRLYESVADSDARQFLRSRLKIRDGRLYWEVDHIQERTRNGADNMENLQTLCSPCHTKKSAAFSRGKRLNGRSSGRPPFAGRRLTFRPLRLDDELWAVIQKLKQEYPTINEGMRAILLNK